VPEAALGQHQQQPSSSSSIAAAAFQQQAPKPPASDIGFTGIAQQQQGARLAGLGPLKSSAVAAASSVATTVGPAALSSRIRPSAALEQQLQVRLTPETHCCVKGCRSFTMKAIAAMLVELDVVVAALPGSLLLCWCFDSKLLLLMVLSGVLVLLIPATSSIPGSKA
jgi:hypothetical protein